MGAPPLPWVHPGVISGWDSRVAGLRMCRAIAAAAAEARGYEADVLDARQACLRGWVTHICVSYRRVQSVRVPVVAMLTWLTLEGHPQLAHAVASRGGLVRAVQGL